MKYDVLARFYLLALFQTVRVQFPSWSSSVGARAVAITKPYFICFLFWFFFLFKSLGLFYFFGFVYILYICCDAFDWWKFMNDERAWTTQTQTQSSDTNGWDETALNTSHTTRPAGCWPARQHPFRLSHTRTYYLHFAPTWKFTERNCKFCK